ncbi:MAG: branched-chain amino acid aminotransferase [Alphaproteobacteria bacterium]
MTQKNLDDRDGFIWMDGAMHPWRETHIHVLSHGLHYATAIFEGERAYNGHIFQSGEHSRRLLKSGEFIHMRLPYTVQQIEDAKHEMLEANKLQNCYMRVVAWRGSEKLGIDYGNTTIHVGIAAWQWDNYFDPEIKKNGIALCSTIWRKPHPDSAPIHSKAASLYNLACMVKYEAKNQGCQDALMLDYEGYIAEATAANFFAVKDGVLFTPIADRFLNGITRQTVMGLAKGLGIEVHEKRIRPEELKDMEEVFLTGSAAELTPVGKIDAWSYKPGAVTKRLQEAYTALVSGGS